MSAKELAIGETGEFLVRSPSLMSEYLGNATATAEALDDDGWYHTGDIGYVDKHQQLYITDRLKEVIKVKGCDLFAIACSRSMSEC